jgi:hypothetical protein
MSYAGVTPLISLFPPAPTLLNPPLNISIATITVETTHNTNPKEAAPTSMRAAVQTEPRQKRSLERKTARAMKPERWKMVVRDSRAKEVYGWEPVHLSISFILSASFCCLRLGTSGGFLRGMGETHL